jgi:hypothetical protein
MAGKANAQTPGELNTVADLDREFARLHAQSRALVERTPDSFLYMPVDQKAGFKSIGDSILRSAAVVEQTFGGITANLWDDPFEWTLPEYLATPEKVCEHLEEVEATRLQAFASFVDEQLLKHVMMPSGETQPLLDLLHNTLARARDFQSQAELALEKLSSNGAPGFII